MFFIYYINFLYESAVEYLDYKFYTSSLSNGDTTLSYTDSTYFNNLIAWSACFCLYFVKFSLYSNFYLLSSLNCIERRLTDFNRPFERTFI